MTKGNPAKPKQKTSTQRRPKRAASTEPPSGACEAAGRSAPPLLSFKAILDAVVRSAHNFSPLMRIKLALPCYLKIEVKHKLLYCLTVAT